jgi:thiol-disulfide isomerase/thioredoxin
MKHLLLALVLGLALLQRTSAEENPPTLPIGSPAPDFNLPGVDGRNYSLKDFARAKVLAVIFTCNHCPTAQYYEDRIKNIVADYKEKGVAVVAISPNDPKSVRLDELGWSDMNDTLEEMKLRAEYENYNFPYLYDGDSQAASRAYGPVATPHIFIFDQERKLRYVGRIDDSEREKAVKVREARLAIDALLDGKEPPVKQTRAVGCSVKWAGKSDQVEKFMAKLAAEPVALEPVDAAGLEALRKNNSGKFRLVNFWATWCAPCIAEFPEFVTINRMYRHRDFELVTVSLNRLDERTRVLEFLKKQQASNKNLIFAAEDRDKLIEAFDPEWPGAVPFTLLLSPEGKVIHRETGMIDPLKLKRLIVRSMNERKPW